MAKTPFSLWFISILLFCAQKSGLYQKRNGSQIRYAKPMQRRISSFVLAASFPWSMTYLKPFSWHWPEYIIFGLLLPLGLVYLSGPNEMTVCLDRRTYTAKFGWPFAPKLWSGHLEDISKIDVRSSESTYLLIVRWKAKRMGINIGQFGTKVEAEAAAAQVSKLLETDVPIGAIGRVGQLSRKR